MAKKKKSNLRKWILLIVFVGIVAAIIAVGSRSGNSGLEVAVDEVERGDITSLVTATGRVHPQIEVVISSEVPGEIVALPVKDGSVVAKGDLLVSVNPDTLEAQVKQQEASLEATRANSAQRKAELLQSRLDLERTQDLHEKGFATQDALDQARTAVEVRQASFDSSLHLIRQQEMQLKEASDQLSKASLYAPIDGTVISLNSEIGDRVVGTGQFAGTEIMRIADLSTMEVRVEVSEADIVNVAIGDKASTEMDALPDEPYDGMVTEIANSAATANSRSREELTTFEVTIRLDEPGERLRPGMSATADIETETVTDVVKVPLGAVVVRPAREIKKLKDAEEGAETSGEDEASKETTESDKEKEDRVRVVFVVEEDTAKLRVVETGIADREDIEILSGLEDGEEIVTGSYRALTRELKDGSAITRRKKDEDQRD
jgi:HlyD family secretion protein